MPTSSIRLSEPVRRAVRESEHTISELAREGIEQTIIDDLVSVCWVCGGGIHRKERRVLLNRQELISKIAPGGLTVDGAPMNRRQHSDFVKFEEAKQQPGIDTDLYFERVVKWLNLPEFQHVDFCSSCAELIDQVQQKSIALTDIPTPYYYQRDPNEDTELRTAGTPPAPEHSYVAESIGVYTADYFSHQRGIFTDDDASKESRQRALLWWAARARNEKIVSADIHPWAEIAARSHGESLWTGRPLERLYYCALQIGHKTDVAAPIVGNDPIPTEFELDDAQGISGQCPACGTHRDLDQYCEACLFPNVDCYSEECSGLLHPHVENRPITEENISFRCEECDQSYPAEPRDAEYTKAISSRYQSVFEEIERTIPFHTENMQSNSS